VKLGVLGPAGRLNWTFEAKLDSLAADRGLRPAETQRELANGDAVFPQLLQGGDIFVIPGARQ
jgi:hypothetical protein